MVDDSGNTHRGTQYNVRNIHTLVPAVAGTAKSSEQIYLILRSESIAIKYTVGDPKWVRH